MKKATFFACACALLMGQSLMAQNNAQEVTYVEDPTQGVLVNKFSNNWFITVDGGAGVYFSSFDDHRKFTDRFAPAADIYVGKWFSPIIGLRLGASWMQNKGLSNGPVAGSLLDEYRPDGYYKTLYNQVGPAADVMINLTNWWCGYKPNRMYNAIVYAGAGGYFTLNNDWHTLRDTNLFGRVGFINSFNVSKRVALSLDIRATLMDGHADNAYNHVDKMFGSLNAYLGVTFNLGKTNWSAPVVPVCPPAENCDALRARLSAAEARVADLERQLQDCLNRKPEVVEAEPEALATIYFPIGVSRLTREDKNIVNAVADVLKADASKKYDVKGYADTYTGSDAINNRLRNQRAGNVVKQLVSRGVSADQVQAVPVQGNLHGDNEALVSLDRCAVIIER
ncbi:MAG: OmpA family protein [Muribaculaceae bacterium]|jgi:outer membrane protein OmpA-like peptidoglycan-associated protein|nr:OmpA family protein [Muribaculaceae bacterium]